MSDPAVFDAIAPTAPCAICGKAGGEMIACGALRPSVAKLIAADHPRLSPTDRICRQHLADYRMRHVEDLLEREKGDISDLERQVVESLAREETISRNVEETWEDRRTVGERLAD